VLLSRARLVAGAVQFLDAVFPSLIGGHDRHRTGDDEKGAGR
jgi:hypothetical protein